MKGRKKRREGRGGGRRRKEKKRKGKRKTEDSKRGKNYLDNNVLVDYTHQGFLHLQFGGF